MDDDMIEDGIIADWFEYVYRLKLLNSKKILFILLKNTNIFLFCII